MDSSTLVEQQRRVIEGVGRQPFDIRQKIWRSLFDTCTIEDQEIIHIVDKNVQAGSTTSSNNIQSVIVDESGGNALFRLFDDVEFGRFRSEFLGEAIKALKDVTFVCGSRFILGKFVDTLGANADFGNAIPKLRIKVDVYSGDFGAFESWEIINGPHGQHHHAFGYFRRLVDDVKRLPEGTTIVLHMLRPWRNYRPLRGFAQMLRDPPHGINLEVAIDTDAWNQIPNPDRHISLTVHAIKGVPFRPVGGFTFAEALDLVDHGCRGFRL